MKKIKFLRIIIIFIFFICPLLWLNNDTHLGCFDNYLCVFFNLFKGLVLWPFLNIWNEHGRDKVIFLYSLFIFGGLSLYLINNNNVKVYLLKIYIVFKKLVTPILLIIIAILMGLNLVTPEFKKRQYYIALQNLLPRTTIEASLWKYNCKINDSSSAIFFVKDKYKVFKIFNTEINSETIDSEDYFGEKDIIKLMEKYDTNKACTFLTIEDTLINSFIPAPKAQ